jgi:hypothetical protein
MTFPELRGERGLETSHAALHLDAFGRQRAYKQAGGGALLERELRLGVDLERKVVERRSPRVDALVHARFERSRIHR